MITFNLTRMALPQFTLARKKNGSTTIYTSSNKRASSINLLYQVNNHIKHGTNYVGTSKPKEAAC